MLNTRIFAYSSEYNAITLIFSNTSLSSQNQQKSNHFKRKTVLKSIVQRKIKIVILFFLKEDNAWHTVDYKRMNDDYLET